MFRIPAVLTFLAVFALPALAGWEEPKDGKIKEIRGVWGLNDEDKKK